MPAPYPQEFREDVVRVARSREDGITIAQIAKDFGVHEMTLHKWIRQADIDDGDLPGKTREESTELRKLRRRNRLLEQENEVLRRAAAYLSQANLPGKGRFYASVSSHPSPKFSEQRPADVSLEAPSNLALGESFGTPALNVFAGGWFVAHPRADDDIDGTVELPVARAGEPVSTSVARGGRQRSYAAERGESRFRAHPPVM